MPDDRIHWFRVPLRRRRFLQGMAAAGTVATLTPPFAFAQSPSILRGRSYADADQMDPAFSTGVNDGEVQDCLYSKLIEFTPGREWDWRLRDAEMIEQVDPTRIRFRLKQGIMWSNGYGELTTEDVKYSFERVIDESLASPIAVDWGPLQGVEIEDRYSGTIVFREPFAPAWQVALPLYVGAIVCKQAWEEAGGRIGTDVPTVSGPYRIKSWTPRQRRVLERNPEYTGDNPAAFDEIHIVPIDDEQTAERAFEAGDLDFTGISVSSLETLKAAPPAGAVIEEYPSLYYVWVGMNLDNPVMQNEQLRRAIQYGIDVTAIMDAAYFGVAEPSTGIIAPGLIGHREQAMVPPAGDLEKARELLAEAGAEGMTLTLDVLNTTTFTTAAQVIQATLGQIGLDVQINLHESGAFWSLGDESQGERWQDIQLILNRFSMSPDPYYATSWFISEQIGIWNWERFSDPEFDELHQKALAETDPEKRDAMYRRMQDIMEATGAYRFITHEASPVMYRDTIVPALRPDGLPIYRHFRKA